MESSNRKDGNNALSLSSATDYYPYGMSMPGRSLTGSEGYRYAFQGQERDPETGKEAFQLRLWDGRIGRWLTTDPKKAGVSPYWGMNNNPVSLTDPDGGKGEINDDIIYKDKAGNVIYTIVESDSDDLFGLLDVVITLSDEQLAKGGFFGYAVELNGSTTHSFLINMENGNYGEASYPKENGEVITNLPRLLDGEGDKSVIRTRDIKSDDFWKENAKYEERKNLVIHMVWVPNKSETIRYMTEHEGSFNYHFITNNCKDFALKALEAGGVKINPFSKHSSIPADFGYKVNAFRYTSEGIYVPKKTDIKLINF